MPILRGNLQMYNVFTVLHTMVHSQNEIFLLLSYRNLIALELTVSVHVQCAAYSVQHKFHLFCAFFSLERPINILFIGDPIIIVQFGILNHFRS